MACESNCCPAEPVSSLAAAAPGAASVPQHHPRYPPPTSYGERDIERDVERETERDRQTEKRARERFRDTDRNRENGGDH